MDRNCLRGKHPGCGIEMFRTRQGGGVRGPCSLKCFLMNHGCGFTATLAGDITRPVTADGAASGHCSHNALQTQIKVGQERIHVVASFRANLRNDRKPFPVVCCVVCGTVRLFFFTTENQFFPVSFVQLVTFNDFNPIDIHPHRAGQGPHMARQVYVYGSQDIVQIFT